MIDKKKVLSEFSLLVAAAIWGGNFVIIKIILADISPMLYLGLRFLIAAVLLLPFLVYKGKFPFGFKLWLKSITVGCLLFMGFAAQTIGLQYTTPGISGFLTGIYVVIVPMIKICISRRLPGAASIWGAVLVALGLSFLSFNGHMGFCLGNLLTLLGAVFFALHFIALGTWSCELDPFFLTFMQMLVTGICSWSVSLFYDPFPHNIAPMSWFALLYGAIPGSLGAFFIQTAAQRFTPPGHAAILLSTEAVFAALISVSIGMEPLTGIKILSFVLVMSGILVSELFSGTGRNSADSCQAI